MQYLYLVAFRLHHDDTYSERWDSVVRAVRAEAEGGVIWEELSSLIVMKSERSVLDLAQAIHEASSIRDSNDLLMIVNPATKEYACVGAMKYPTTLKTLFY
ncbi:MAG: hypothetical protein QNI90_02970 [Dinoroseobacter sp.]|nr:hypothetical protein [Dinoroseobacter sp.]